MEKTLTWIIVVCCGFLTWFMLSGGLHKVVANDLAAQYNIARRSGNVMDMCVHAGIVAAANLQAKNESGYAEWKSTERSDCARAGVYR